MGQGPGYFLPYLSSEMTWRCRRLLSPHHTKEGGRRKGGDFCLSFFFFLFFLLLTWLPILFVFYAGLPQRHPPRKQQPSTTSRTQPIQPNPTYFTRNRGIQTCIRSHIPSPPTTMNASWHRPAGGHHAKERSHCIARISSAILLVAMAIPALVQAGPGRASITTTEFRSSPRKLSYFQDSPVRTTHVSPVLLLLLDASPSYTKHYHLQTLMHFL